MKALVAVLWGNVLGMLALALLKWTGIAISYGLLFGLATLLMILALLRGSVLEHTSAKGKQTQPAKHPATPKPPVKARTG